MAAVTCLTAYIPPLVPMLKLASEAQVCTLPLSTASYKAACFCWIVHSIFHFFLFIPLELLERYIVHMSETPTPASFFIETLSPEEIK